MFDKGPGHDVLDLNIARNGGQGQSLSGDKLRQRRLGVLGMIGAVLREAGSVRVWTFEILTESQGNVKERLKNLAILA